MLTESLWLKMLDPMQTHLLATELAKRDVHIAERDAHIADLERQITKIRPEWTKFIIYAVVAFTTAMTIFGLSAAGLYWSLWTEAKKAAENKVNDYLKDGSVVQAAFNVHIRDVKAVETAANDAGLKLARIIQYEKEAKTAWDNLTDTKHVDKLSVRELLVTTVDDKDRRKTVTIKDGVIHAGEFGVTDELGNPRIRLLHDKGDESYHVQILGSQGNERIDLFAQNNPNLEDRMTVIELFGVNYDAMDMKKKNHRTSIKIDSKGSVTP